MFVRLSLLLLLIALPLSGSLNLASAQPAAAFGTANPDPFSQAPRFLPVEEAYRLSAAFIGDQLVLHWEIAPGYYLYRHRFSATTEAGAALELLLPPGLAHEDEYFGRVEVFYEQVEAQLASLPAEPFTLLITSQGCADAGLCYPPQTERWQIDPQRASAGPLGSVAPGSGTVPTAGTADAGTSWLLMALFALLGGALLNLMPCVFPVLGLKAMSFSRAREGALWHGVSYTAGVALSFVALAGLLLALRSGGQALGWGFQLQQPVVIAALAWLFVALGLSLSGLWSLGTAWMGAGQRWTERGGLAGSFATGVLATVVASPCTAPLMGTAMGFALLQPTFSALSLFALLGLGMALPLLILSASPALLRFLPRPGPWMERFKEALAFPLYGSAIWLCWVIGRQTGSSGMALVLLGALLIALALWLLRFGLGGRLAGAAVAGVAVALLASPLLQPGAGKGAASGAPELHAGATPYSAARLAELRAAGTPVLVNATADWCLTCLANERVALGSEAVQLHLRARGIVYMVADWTHYDAAISAFLASFGRNGVPLYVFYPADGGEARVLPQLLTPKTVIAALSE